MPNENESLSVQSSSSPLHSLPKLKFAAWPSYTGAQKRRTIINRHVSKQTRKIYSAPLSKVGEGTGIGERYTNTAAKASRIARIAKTAVSAPRPSAESDATIQVTVAKNATKALEMIR